MLRQSLAVVCGLLIGACSKSPAPENPSPQANPPDTTSATPSATPRDTTNMGQPNVGQPTDTSNMGQPRDTTNLAPKDTSTMSQPSAGQADTTNMGQPRADASVSAGVASDTAAKDSANPITKANATGGFASSSGSADRGRATWVANGCGSCHSWSMRANAKGPSLLGISDRRDAGWLGEFLKNPDFAVKGSLRDKVPDSTYQQWEQRYGKDFKHPNPDLSKSDIDDLINYMAAQTERVKSHKVQKQQQKQAH
jgi:cytochrome c551/c552